MALVELSEEDLRDVEVVGEIPLPRGDVRVLLALVGELNPNKRARVNLGPGALPPLPPNIQLDGVEGGEMAPKGKAKQSFAVFTSGEELLTVETKDLSQRVTDATLMVRAGEGDRRVLYGIGPPFVGVLTGEGLARLASDVMMAQAAGTGKEGATNAVQVLWGLGALAKLAGARVWTDKDLLSRVIKGEWEKFRLDGLSLRDFNHAGRFPVSRTVMVDYSFVRQLKDSLAGLELVTTAVLSPKLGGFTSALSSRLEVGCLELVSSSQLLLYTMINDSLVDAFKELRTSVKGVGGASLNGPDRVKVLLETGLGHVQLPNLVGGPAQVELFNRLRGDLYVLVAKAASAGTGGGVAAEEVKKAEDKGVGRGGGKGPVLEAKTECLDSLRNSLGLKNHNGVVIKTCTNSLCKFEHTALFRINKRGWKDEVDRSVGTANRSAGWVLEIKAAIDGSPKIKA